MNKFDCGWGAVYEQLQQQHYMAQYNNLQQWQGKAGQMQGLVSETSNLHPENWHCSNPLQPQMLDVLTYHHETIVCDQWYLEECIILQYQRTCMCDKYKHCWFLHVQTTTEYFSKECVCERLTGEPVLVSVLLHYAGFLCKVDVYRAWNLRQFL